MCGKYLVFYKQLSTVLLFVALNSPGDCIFSSLSGTDSFLISDSPGDCLLFSYPSASLPLTPQRAVCLSLPYLVTLGFYLVVGKYFLFTYCTQTYGVCDILELLQFVARALCKSVELKILQSQLVSPTVRSYFCIPLNSLRAHPSMGAVPVPN